MDSFMKINDQLTQQTSYSQLSELLESNKILVENKRNLYQQKIKTYNEKSLKIKKLMQTAVDQEEKNFLSQKLKVTQQKQHQSMDKLKKIQIIETDMKSYSQSYSKDKDEDGRPFSKSKRKSIRPILSELNLNFGKSMKQFGLETRENPRFSTYHDAQTYKQIQFDDESETQQQYKHEYSNAESQAEKKLCKIFQIIGKQKPKQIVDCFQQLLEWLDSLPFTQLSHKIDQLIEKERKLLQSIDHLNEYHEEECEKIQTTFKGISKKLGLYNSQNFSSSRLEDIANQFYSSLEKFGNEKKSNLNELNNKIFDMQEKTMKLQVQKTKKEEQISQKCQKIKMVNRQLKQKQQKLSISVEKYEKLQKEYEQIHLKHEKEQSNIQEMNSIANIRKKGYDQLVNKYESLKNKKKKLIQKIDILSENIVELQKEKADIESEIKKRKSYLEELNSELKEVLYQKQTSSKIVSELEEEGNKKQKELQLITKSIKEEKKNYDDITSSLTLKNKELQELENILGKNLSEISEKKRKIDDLQQKEKKNQEDMTKISQEHKKILIDYEELSKRTSEMKKQEEELKLCLSKQREQNKEMEQYQSQLQNSLNGLAFEVKQLEAGRDDLEQMIAVIMKKKDSLFLQIQNKANELAKIEEESNTYTERMNIYDEQLHQMKQKLQKTTKQYQDTTRSLKEAKSKLCQIVDEIEYNRDEQENLQQRVKKLKKIEYKMSLQLGKGSPLDEEQNLRLQEILNDLDNISELKQQVKKSKQEVRKLKLQNQKLIQMEERKSLN